MPTILSHQLAVEYFRNLRSSALTRPRSMKEWLAAPERGILTTRSGQLNLARGVIAQSRHLSSPVLTASACNDVLAASTMPTPEEVARIFQNIPLLESASSPFHVIVGEQSKRHSSSLAQCHLVHRTLWDGALWKVAEDVYICSPELVFLQMAAHLARPHLVRFGMELCGGYCIQPHSSKGFDDVYAITTPRLLTEAVSCADGMVGTKNARIAVRRILSNAASPAESNIYIVFCFPRREGGYGLMHPELNGMVTVRLNNGEEFERFCDLLWREYCIAIEYLGQDSHDDLRTAFSDATRQGDLVMNGVRIIPVTKEHVRSISRLDCVAEAIEKNFGKKRKRPPADFRKKQLELHKMIYPWAH